MKYAPQALFVFAILAFGSLRFIQASPGRIAAHPAPVAGDERLAAATTLVENATVNVSIAEQDGRAQYERAELAAVRFDIMTCQTAATNDDFLIDVEQLKRDAAKFDALDDTLQRDWLL